MLTNEQNEDEIFEDEDGVAEEVAEHQIVRILPKVPEGAVLLGEGRLNWSRYERVGDRYGTLGLWDDDSDTLLAIADVPARGHLICEVLETRSSGHIGDLFHGAFPGGAVLGEVVVLNPTQGSIYLPDPTDETAYATQRGRRIGVEPDDDREYFWLSVAALYRMHDQTVRLYACETIG